MKMNAVARLVRNIPSAPNMQGNAPKMIGRYGALVVGRGRVLAPTIARQDAVGAIRKRDTNTIVLVWRSQ